MGQDEIKKASETVCEVRKLAEAVEKRVSDSVRRMKATQPRK